MKTTNAQPVGAMHPILFFTIVYGIFLFFGLFICSAVYNSLQQLTTTASVVEKSEKTSANMKLTAQVSASPLP